MKGYTTQVINASQFSYRFGRVISAVVLLAMICVSTTPSLATITVYTGALSSSTPDEVTSNGDGWGADRDGFKVTWTISKNTDFTWHYKYEFFKANGQPLTKLISYFDISLFENIQSYDLFDFSENIADPPTFGTFGPSPSSPGFPTGETITGVKFDMINTQDIVEFNSTHKPMWGDFYAKGGKSRALGWNYAYNTDLGIDIINMQDLTNPALDSQGNELHKILVPNATPEPTTICMLGMGALVLFRKRRK